MTIDIFRFRGTQPQRDPKKIGAEYGELAHNCYLRSTSLDPLKAGLLQTTPQGHNFSLTQTLYKFNGNFIGPAEDTNFVQSAVRDDVLDRLFFVDNGLLQFYPEPEIPNGMPTNLLLGHRLGVPVPPTTQLGSSGNIEGDLGPVVSNVGLSPDPGPNVYSTVFVYTYVNKFGDEGPPSLASNLINVLRGGQLSISVIAETTNPDIIGIRLYAAIDGEYFRYSRPEHTYDDGTYRVEALNATNATQTLQITFQPASIRGALVSGGNNDDLDWDQPPSGIKHLIEVDGGGLVAASDNTLYFSEPYRVHAWPLAYRVGIPNKIKALAKIDGGFVVLTDQEIHLFAGSSPLTTVEIPNTFHHPIGDTGSICRVGNGISYATVEGIAFVALNDQRILTDGVITREQWEKMVSVDEFKAEVYEGRIVFMTRDPVENVVVGYIYNMRQSEFTSFDSDQTSITLGYYRDPETNKLLTVRGGDLYSFDEGPEMVPKHRTGKMPLPHGMNYHAVRVESDVYPVKIRINAEGRLYEQDIDSNEPERMEPTGRARWVTLETEPGAPGRVSSVQFGPDLRSVM